MATPNEKLAASLGKLKELQQGGRRVFKSADFTRTDRQRLSQNGFLKEIMKGWLMSASPNTPPSDTTPWYASFWEFCARYCEDRFGPAWYLSAEQSLLLLAESTVIPSQVIVNSPRGTNNKVSLPFGASLYDVKQKDIPPNADLLLKDGLRMFSSAAALIRVPDNFFSRNPIEAQVGLAGIKDASEILGRLLEGGHTVVAGKLAGALRHLSRAEVADEIIKTMKGAGYDVREADPFAGTQTIRKLAIGDTPIAGRIRTLWETHRDAVIREFPKAPGMPKNTKPYLKFIDAIYKNDAYHSLSIEGYSVTPKLIERVRSGNWSPAENEDDRKNRDALAARGYWQAFQSVKRSVITILKGDRAGPIVRSDHRDWYRELFQPSVAAGLIRPAMLAGYRREPVYLKGSRHIPPRAASVPDAMNIFFDLIEKEKEAAPRIVLGHWLFGYIHPYLDGNGRMARFLMNAMLASAGYPWTVIRVEDRQAYMTALEAASVENNLKPFTAFIAERVKWSLKTAARDR